MADSQQYVCSLCGRGAPFLKRGWCGRCYQRWQNHGDPTFTLRIMKDDEARFQSKMGAPSADPDACHPYGGRIDARGYGDFNVGGRHVYAHVYAYGLANGPVSPGMDVDHVCHDPKVCNLKNLCPHRRCCNPRHLEAVTHLENILRSGRTKLSDAEVAVLADRLRNGETMVALAAEVGVNERTIARRVRSSRIPNPVVGDLRKVG